jgi:hypothetical protein
MAIFHLPFSYRMRFIPPKRRRGESFNLRDMAPFEIQEVTASDAPISVLWKRRGPPHPHAIDPATRDEIVIRAWHGKSFCRLEAPNGEPIGIKEFLADVAAAPSVWSDGEPGKPRWPIYRYPAVPGFLTSLNLRVREDVAAELRRMAEGGNLRVESDDLDEHLAAATRFMSETLLIVDGDIWTTQQVWEPWWRVIPWENEVRLGVGFGHPRFHIDSPFRADRREDATAFARELAASTGYTFVDTADTLDIKDASLLTRDDVVMTAEQLCRGSGREIDRRDYPEKWPRETEIADAEMLRLNNEENVHHRDMDWATSVFAAAADFRVSLPKPLLDSLPQAQKIISNTNYAFARWKMEATQRPDLAKMVEIKQTTRTAEEDEALGFFAPNGK